MSWYTSLFYKYITVKHRVHSPRENEKRTITFQYNKLLTCLYDNKNSMRKYYRVSPKLIPFCHSQKMDRESLKTEKPQKEIYWYQLLLF